MVDAENMAAVFVGLDRVLKHCIFILILALKYEINDEKWLENSYFCLVKKIPLTLFHTEPNNYLAFKKIEMT